MNYGQYQSSNEYSSYDKWFHAGRSNTFVWLLHLHHFGMTETGDFKFFYYRQWAIAENWSLSSRKLPSLVINKFHNQRWVRKLVLPRQTGCKLAHLRGFLQGPSFEQIATTQVTVCNESTESKRTPGVGGNPAELCNMQITRACNWSNKLFDFAQSISIEISTYYGRGLLQVCSFALLYRWKDLYRSRRGFLVAFLHVGGHFSN